MKFREITLSSGNRVLLGRNAENNDELVKKFEGETNTILHTSSPGSPFGVILDKPSKKELYEAAVWVARYSQDWRDNKNDIKVDVFTGKDVKKKEGMKTGTWNVKKSKKIKVKKSNILKFENDTRTSTTR